MLTKPTPKNTFQFYATQIEGHGILILIPDTFSTLCLYPEEVLYISVIGEAGRDMTWKDCRTTFHGDPLEVSHMLTATELNNVTPGSENPETLSRDPFDSDVIFGGRLLPRETELAPNRELRVLDCGLYNFKVAVQAEEAGAPITFHSSDPRIVVGDNRGGIGWGKPRP